MRVHRSYAVAALALSACASTQIPKTVASSHLAGAQNAIAAADTEAAGQNQHLQLAHKEFSSAQHLMTHGATEKADAMLLRAQADAQLALAQAREASAQAEARQMAERIRALSTTSMTETQPTKDQP